LVAAAAGNAVESARLIVAAGSRSLLTRCDALTVAAERGHLEVTEFLLSDETGFDGNEEDTYAAVSKALDGRFWSLAAALIRHGASPDPSFYHPRPKSSRGAGRDEAPRLGHLLQEARSGGATPAVLSLAEAMMERRDPNRKWFSGLTPLLAAIKLGSAKLVALLLEKGRIRGWRARGRRWRPRSVVPRRGAAVTKWSS
jgi:ankyrin repeat protein